MTDVSKDAVFSFGYDYTTKGGVIFGGYYVPRLLSESGSYYDTFWGYYNRSIESQVLGLYTGYQFDNNLRLTGGLSFTYTEESVDYLFYSETVVGLMLGLDYLIAEKFLIGARVSAHEYDNLSATVVGINLGYKF